MKNAIVVSLLVIFHESIYVIYWQYQQRTQWVRVSEINRLSRAQSNRITHSPTHFERKQLTEH